MPWNEILEQLQPSIFTLLSVLLSGVVGWATLKVKTYFQDKVDTDTKKAIIKDTVLYVQQVYEKLDGTEKLKKATETAIEWLNSKNVSITEVEVRILIEAAIMEAKNAWNSEPKEIQGDDIVWEKVVEDNTAVEVEKGEITE